MYQKKDETIIKTLYNHSRFTRVSARCKHLSLWRYTYMSENVYHKIKLKLLY